MRKFDDFDDFDDFDGPARDPVDVTPYVRRVIKHWKAVLMWACCGALLGIIIGFSTPRTYTSTAVVAPELATRSTLSSGLSSLANLAGVNMNSLAITDAMHPDLYPVVIRSTTFYMGLFDLPVSFTHKGKVVQTDLYDYITHYTKAPWYGYVLGLPRMGIEAVKSLFTKKDEFDLAEGHSHVDSLRLTRQQEGVVKALQRSITSSVEKRTYVLSVKVKMQDRLVAAQVANAVVENLKQFVVAYRTEKAQENVKYYEKVYEEAHADYLAAQRAYASYVDSHLGSTSRSSQVQQQYLQYEAQIKYQMYNSTTQNLLAAKAKVQQESPVLVVIQRAMAPHIGKPSKVKLAILWFILGAMAGCFFVLIQAHRKEDKQ